MSSVTLEPAELGFQRPFAHEVSQVLRLHNPNSDPVAFKVKTTAPKQYCVRPNSGRIEPGRDVEVQVLLQAMKEDPPPDTRCRDKFLVQSVSVPADKEVGTVSQIWSNIEATAKSSIQEKKIRVNFLPADGSAAPNGISHHEEDHAPPAYSSPSSAAVTPARTIADRAMGPISTPSDRPLDAKSRGEAVESAYNPAAEPVTVGPTASAIGNTLGISSQDLQRQLDSANAKIKELQQTASDGLRQRNVGKSGNEKSVTSMQQTQAPGGVPVQIVALLCLLSFVLAWLFF